MFVTAKPPYPYIDVGLLQARAGSGMSQQDVLDALRRKAGRIGCDAIVIVGGIEEEDFPPATTAVSSFPPPQ